MPATKLSEQQTASRSRRLRRWGLFALLWSLAIVFGVLATKLFDWESRSPWLASVGASEWVHVIAHGVLYGTLSAAFTQMLRRPWLAVPLTLCVGAVQEGVQVVFSVHGVSSAELFDLTVDAMAASAAAWVFRPRAAKPSEALLSE